MYRIRHIFSLRELTTLCLCRFGVSKHPFSKLFVYLFIYLLTAPYQAPHLVHKMLVLKDIAVFSFPGVLYGWILQSDLTLPCDLEWPLAGRWKWCPSDVLLPLTLFLVYFRHQGSTDTSKWFLKTSCHLANIRITFSHKQIHFPTPFFKIQIIFSSSKRMTIFSLVIVHAVLFWSFFVHFRCRSLQSMFLFFNLAHNWYNSRGFKTSLFPLSGAFCGQRRRVRNKVPKDKGIGGYLVSIEPSPNIMVFWQGQYSSMLKKSINTQKTMSKRKDQTCEAFYFYRILG